MKTEKIYVGYLLKQATEIASRYENFTDGVRVFFLIKRSKEGGSNKGDKVRKIVSKGKEQVIDIIHDLLVDKWELFRDPQMRIYMSANPRNMKKAVRQFKQQMLDNDYNGNEVMEDFYFDLKNRWISSLMKPSSRASTVFLIDCDSKEEYAVAIEELKGLETYIWDYPTRNGTHIVTRPFNPALMPKTKEKIHKDGLLLLDF